MSYAVIRADSVPVLILEESPLVRKKYNTSYTHGYYFPGIIK